MWVIHSAKMAQQYSTGLWCAEIPYRDGTTHVYFSPVDFIARLAALVPKPRVNLTRFHGVPSCQRSGDPRPLPSVQGWAVLAKTETMGRLGQGIAYKAGGMKPQITPGSRWFEDNRPFILPIRLSVINYRNNMRGTRNTRPLQ